VTNTLATQPLRARIDAALAGRTELNREFFAGEAERVARCCHAMAERFGRGGRLLAIGTGGSTGSDAAHIAVEFVHPVIVGKRALPALVVPDEARLSLIAAPEDIVVGFGPESGPALAAARGRGCLTLAFGADAEWSFSPPGDDEFIRQELAETLYHVLWELVHVFFEHRGLLAGRDAGPVHDTGASSFLYPFLGERERDLDGVLADVRESVLMKAAEVGELREQTLTENGVELGATAVALRELLDGGGKVLAFGNGGSATDAADLVADLVEPPQPSWRPRAAMDLSSEPAILTAIANDVGVENIFARQVIAHGVAGDAAVAISTSGNSVNLIAALIEARRRGLLTVALVGYDGGRIAAEGLADRVVVTRSQHIPRIQEAQASAYHVLRELIEAA